MFNVFKRPEDYDSLRRRFEEIEMVRFQPATYDEYGTMITQETLDFRGNLTIKS